MVAARNRRTHEAPLRRRASSRSRTLTAPGERRAPREPRGRVLWRRLWWDRRAPVRLLGVHAGQAPWPREAQLELPLE